MIDLMKAIQDDLYVLLEYTMRQYGLGQSEVLDDARININDNFFLLVFPDYIEYINSGRRPNSSLPPYDAILNWCREKGVSTDNNTVWRIRQGIARNGIAARPVLDMLFDLADNEWTTEWAEMCFNEIIKELNNWFQQ